MAFEPQLEDHPILIPSTQLKYFPGNPGLVLRSVLDLFMTWGPILNVLWIALSHSTLWLQLPLVWSFKSFSFHVFRPVKTS